MKKQILWILSPAFLFFAIYANGTNFAKIDFSKNAQGGPSEYFSSFVGKWHIDKDGKNSVYAVDGRKWTRGAMSRGIADKARAIYGKRYAEFLDNLEAYKYFPLSVCKPIGNFTNGSVSVKFKGISGRIDQAAGIAFNIKRNGDYLVIRANPLENNMVAFKMQKGRRSVVQWIRKIPIASRKWYDLKVRVNGREIRGYLNGKEYIHFREKKPVSGKIGLWSKSDSYVFFDDFIAKPKKKIKKKKISKRKFPAVKERIGGK